MREAAATRSDREARTLRRQRPHLLERMPDQLAQARKVARTFQNIRLFSGHDGAREPAGRPAQPADDGVGLSPCSACSASPATRRAEAEAIERAKSWLEKIGLIDRADDPAGDLPYGAQRRLEIARAMCTEPVLLCLDEPAAGLNPRESLELNTLLRVDPRRARHLASC